jgi:hypothetical protein
MPLFLHLFFLYTIVSFIHHSTNFLLQPVTTPSINEKICKTEMLLGCCLHCVVVTGDELSPLPLLLAINYNDSP